MIVDLYLAIAKLFSWLLTFMDLGLTVHLLLTYYLKETGQKNVYFLQDNWGVSSWVNILKNGLWFLTIYLCEITMVLRVVFCWEGKLCISYFNQMYVKCHGFLENIIFMQ